MQKITIALLLLVSGQVFSQAYSGPESAEYDYANNRWLIANTSSHEVLARNGSGVLSVFASGLVSGPYGIEIAGNVLYCCSGASVKGYDLTTGANVFNLNVGATFLNGLAHDNSGNLYATDFTAKKIYKIVIAASTFSVIATGLAQSPNGIIYDQPNNRCIFVNWGANAPIKAIDLNTFNVTTLVTTAYSNCDGIARDAAGNYYVSVWGSQSVVRFDSAFANPTPIATGLSNPADVFVNTSANMLAIPNSGNNTVSFINLTLGIFHPSPDESAIKSIRVFPNPVLTDATFQFELTDIRKVSAEIVDLHGRKIKTIDMGSEFRQGGSFPINLSNVDTGSYYLVFKADEESKAIPLLVKND